LSGQVDDSPFGQLVLELKPEPTLSGIS